ncbi:MAG: AI-2E family transporter [Verrucomicrobia bacterium]|nr:AI-2E family transporter [Verrucomicrobiota bacterium]
MNFPPPTEKQARIIWLSLTGLAAALIVALIVAAVWGLGRILNVLSSVIWPLAVAGVLAYLLDPVVDLLQRKGVPRVRAIIVVFLAALLIILGLLASVVPQLVVESQELGRKIPGYTQRLEKKVETLISHPPAWLQRFLPKQSSANVETPSATSTNAEPAALAAAPSETNAPQSITPDKSPPPPVIDKATLASATDWLTKALPILGKRLSQVVSYIGSWFGVIAGLALIPIYAFYFLLEKSGIESKWTDYLPVHDSKFKDELVFILNSINDYLIAFFRGQVLVAICDGILYTIGFTIIGLPYSVLIGVMATFLTIIPFLGAITTCVTALVIALVAFGDWQHPLGVLLVVGIVQALEGTVIQPKIMGDRVGLHPVSIIVALMVGTTLLGGILGGILAIPLTAALRVIMFRYVWKKREI